MPEEGPLCMLDYVNTSDAKETVHESVHSTHACFFQAEGTITQ